MIQPDTPISVTLTAREWNAAMTAMGEGLSAMQRIIADIQRQCIAADRAAPFMAPRPNGEDAEERPAA